MQHTITKELLTEQAYFIVLSSHSNIKRLLLWTYIFNTGQMSDTQYKIEYLGKVQLVTKDLDEAITKYNEL